MRAIRKGPENENFAGKNLGVLYTGYLDKRNPVTGSFKKRFVVLTRDAIHWFKRAEGCDLFGEERGHVTLSNLLTARMLDEDTTTFEIQGTDHKTRLFRAATPVFCEEWVSAIRSAMKRNNSVLRKGAAMDANSTSASNTGGSGGGGVGPSFRRVSLAGIRNIFDDDPEGLNEQYDNTEVTVLLVSLQSSSQQSEIVIARNPEWERVITIPQVKPGDELIMSTSNGGLVTLSEAMIAQKAENGMEFEVAVQNVPLASSLKISLIEDMVEMDRSPFSSKIGSVSSIKPSGRGGGMGGGSDGMEGNVVLKKWMAFAISLTKERSTAINLVLSLMVIVVGVSSVFALGTDTSLLFLFASLLAVYNLSQLIGGAKEELQEKSKAKKLSLILHGHTFTSPDAPINEPEDEIPQRFIDGCDGDLKEARKRWDVTRHWRDTEGVNDILKEPQPHYHLMKKFYPHYVCGVGLSGHTVSYERPGDFETAQLEARGVTLHDMVRHWLFNNEYYWNILCGGSETAKSIAVIDLNGIKTSDLGGTIFELMKTTMGIANLHYPERSHVIFLINAPWYFSMMWKLVKPLVHPNTQRKIRILSAKEVLTGLQEHIHISQIPEFYGGELDYGGHDSCRFRSPETLAMNAFVKEINGGSNAEGEETDGVDRGGSFSPRTGPHNPSSHNPNAGPTPPGAPGVSSADGRAALLMDESGKESSLAAVSRDSSELTTSTTLPASSSSASSSIRGAGAVGTASIKNNPSVTSGSRPTAGAAAADDDDRDGRAKTVIPRLLLGKAGNSRNRGRQTSDDWSISSSTTNGASIAQSHGPDTTATTTTAAAASMHVPHNRSRPAPLSMHPPAPLSSFAAAAGHHDSTPDPSTPGTISSVKSEHGSLYHGRGGGGGGVRTGSAAAFAALNAPTPRPGEEEELVVPRGGATARTTTAGDRGRNGATTRSSSSAMGQYGGNNSSFASRAQNKAVLSPAVSLKRANYTAYS